MESYEFITSANSPRNPAIPNAKMITSLADDIGLDLDHQVGPVFPDGVADAPPRQVPDPRRQFSETLVGKVEGVEWSAIDLVHGFGMGIAAAGITGDGAAFRPLPTVSDSAR